MSLSATCLVELALLKYYTDVFTRAVVSDISGVIQSLISEGLVSIVDDSRRSSGPITVAIMDKGRQLLKEVSSSTLIMALAESSRWPLLFIFRDEVTMEDLPTLLAHEEVRVRQFAESRHKELMNVK